MFVEEVHRHLAPTKVT